MAAALRAVVLAAGRGTRLGAAGRSLPKPLWRLGGATILEQNMSLLSSAGVTHAAINLHHLGWAIRSRIGDGRELGLSVTYSEEEALLGTAGGARRAQSLLPATWPLVVLYGDNLVRVDLKRMIGAHQASRPEATIAVHWLEDVRSSGLVEFDQSGRIYGFVEKPESQTVRAGWVNAGVYVLEEMVIEAIPDDGPADFGFDIFPRLLAAGTHLHAYPLGPEEEVFPIDTPEKYQRALRAVGAKHRGPG